ncbi:MAG: endonuclease/exonuclease/phosphatase family protein [Bacteroidota bacterium]|nr:endonuclease/exonuclease/phosphatase family protein [Bacteroidota bacterium]
MTPIRTILIPLLCTIVLGGCTTQDSPSSLELKAMSFNIRYANPGDGVDVWENRRDWVSALIDSSDADVVGLQEVLHQQLEDIMARTERFSWVGAGRDDGLQAGEYSPILYDMSRFELVSTTTRWLSSTPDSVGSRGWDAALPRVATQAVLKERSSGRTVSMWNTHFDHRGVEARVQSALLIREWMQGHDLATGDFNVEPESPAWTELVSDGLIDAGRAAGMDTVGTFRTFDASSDVSVRIDYVFLPPGHTMTGYQVMAPVRDGRYPSDHLPVVVTLKMDGAD